MQFDRQIKTAERLIAKYGQSVVWKQRTILENDIEPWNPGAGAETENNCIICFLPVSRVQMETFHLMKGTEVSEVSVMGYMSQVPFKPAIGDTVVKDGEVLTVKNVNLLSPNGQKILYTILFS